jgi:hypothetical protein
MTNHRARTGSPRTMPDPRRRRWGRGTAACLLRRLVVALAVTLLTAACGQAPAPRPDQARPKATLSAPAERQPGAAAASVLPAVEVLDVPSGTTVDLSSLIPADLPTLLWFWAPH